MGIAVMDANEFRVTPAHLDHHAGSVDDLAAEVEVAAQAAQAVQFDNEAYGVFCQALPVMMAPLTNLVVDAVGSTVDNLTDVAAKVHTVAGNYRASDTGASARFGAP
jgi:hypothetical protein